MGASGFRREAQPRRVEGFVEVWFAAARCAAARLAAARPAGPQAAGSTAAPCTCTPGVTSVRCVPPSPPPASWGLPGRGAGALVALVAGGRAPACGLSEAQARAHRQAHGARAPRHPPRGAARLPRPCAVPLDAQYVRTLVQLAELAQRRARCGAPGRGGAPGACACGLPRRQRRGAAARGRGRGHGARWVGAGVRRLLPPGCGCGCGCGCGLGAAAGSDGAATHTHARETVPSVMQTD